MSDPCVILKVQEKRERLEDEPPEQIRSKTDMSLKKQISLKSLRKETKMRIRTPEQQAIIDRFRNNHEESLREFEDAE